MQILAFGDSITWGSYTEKGWAEQLRLFLWKKEDADDIYRRMYGLGIPGETTADLLKRFLVEAEARIQKKYGQTVLLFAFGSNDSALVIGEQRMAVPLDQYKENLEKVFEQASKWSPLIFLLTSPPLFQEGINESGTKERSNKDIDLYNAALKELAEKRSLGIIDINTAFRQQDLSQLFIEDGVHPNEKGHQLIFEEVSKALEEYTK